MGFCRVTPSLIITNHHVLRTFVGVPIETLWVVRFCGLCVRVHAKGSSDVDPLIPRLSIQSLQLVLIV